MPLYLVDASVWILALRRSPVPTIRDVLADLLHNDLVATCPLVELELLGGAATEAELARLEARLRGLHRIEFVDEDWRSAARLAFALRRRGVTVPFTDLLLAALAIRIDATLLHVDRDFDQIARYASVRVRSLVDLLPGT
jgi:predicted nucleic acid-binding protein